MKKSVSTLGGAVVKARRTKARGGTTFLTAAEKRQSEAFARKARRILREAGVTESDIAREISEVRRELREENEHGKSEKRA